VKPFPEEHELLALFEVEPTLLDAGIPWVYNTLTFASLRDGHRVECTIVPGYGELRVAWSNAAQSLVDIRLNQVEGLRVEIGKTREALVAEFSEKTGLGLLTIELKPTIRLTWTNEVR
jgi:hypothetical protein